MWTTVIILAALPCFIFGQTNYCAMDPKHTMCQYSPSACPAKTLYVSGITAAEQQTIVNVHNQLRNKVATGQETGQPSASNMRQFVYDTELATIAQRWADQCVMGHDADRNSARFYVGQNAASTSSSADSNRASNFTQAIYMWHNEVSSFNPQNINPFVFTSATGHYTQVVWADTMYVGCGFTYYKDGSWYTKLYICNYGPGGNIISGTMYKTGASASACTAGKSTTYTGLCN